MGRFSRLTLLSGLMLIPALLFGQFNNNTTSPYSRYGIGDLQDYAFGRTIAMGGAAIASRYDRQINLANPASYNAIDSLGFMFEFGIDGRGSKYKNDLGSTNANDINFQYFAMNFRVSNYVGAALGLTPFSDVGYDVNVMENWIMWDKHIFIITVLVQFPGLFSDWLLNLLKIFLLEQTLIILSECSTAIRKLTSWMDMIIT